jgi:hypothetical protein
VPDGRYVYYIIAENAAGAREPPTSGDGVIMVGALPVQSPMDLSLLFMIIGSAAAAGAALLFFAKRQRSITLFVPAEAVAVVDDIRDRYPDAAVADYVEPATDGRKYVGVTIPKSADGEWLSEIAGRVKEMAEVDSVSLRYKGKMQVL